jgi:translocation and assembly module TamB
LRLLVKAILFIAFLPCAVLAQEDSEDDGGFLTRTIEGALSGAGREVDIRGFKGALSSEATFDSMTIADDTGVWLTLENVSLIWSRAALLRGQLNVDSLTAQSLEITRLPDPGEQPVELPSAEAEEFSLQLPELPVSINLANFEVARIALGAPLLGAPAELSLKATARLDDEGLFADLTAQRIDDVAGTFAVKSNIFRDGAEIDVNLALQEAADGITATLLRLPGLPSVDLSVAGQGPLDDFTADIALQTDETPRLAGQIILSAEPVGGDTPSGPDRRIRANLGGDITALVAPEYQDFFGPDVGLVVNTVLRADGAVDVESFSIEAKALDLAGKVLLNQDLWPSFVDVEGAIAQAGVPVVLPGSDAGVTVESILLDVSFDAAQGDAFTGRFDITNFRQEAVTLANTKLSLDGILDGDVDAIGRFAADIALDVTGVAFADNTSAQAVGDTINGGFRIDYTEEQPLEISNISLAGVDFGIAGDVIVQSFEGGIPIDLNVEVAAEDLSRFSALAGQTLGGAADLSVAGRIVPLSSMFDLMITGSAQDVVTGIAEADGLLTGATRLSLGAERGTTGTFLHNLSLQNDAVQVAADVALRSAGSTVDAQMRLVDLGLVLPQYQGPVSLVADGEQTAEGWQVDVSLDAPYDSSMRVVGLATGPDADLAFDVSVPETSNYAPQAKGPLLAEGRLWQASEGYQIDVRAAAPFGISLDVEGLATGPDALVNFDANIPDLAVLVPGFGGAFDIDGAIAKAGEDWRVESRIAGPAGLDATLAGTAASDVSTVDLGINGVLPLGLAGPLLAPRSVSGDAAFDLALKGAPGLDALSGSITTSDVRFSAPNLKLALENIAARIDLAGSNTRLDVGGDFTSGGSLSVQGGVDISSLAGDLTIALRDATFIDPNLYAATLGADITVNGLLTGGARIAGDINVQEVNVTVPGTGVTSIGAIPEIRHLRPGKAVTATRARAGVLPPEQTTATTAPSRPFPLDIRIDAPSKIFVRGRGINAELGGDLEIGGDTDNIISAGSLDLIRGRLDIIGKRFQLDEGSVQFQGSVTPYILFVTTTDIPDGTASITVEGLASEPEITFSSDPEQPEDEVMSLILFGRYVSELSAFQALQLANGVAQLTGRSGVNLIGGLRDGIGLDELDVTTDETGATSVSAGKYITDDIYTDITNNSERGTDISLNIDLTDALTGRATMAEDGDSSVGLFFERDY